MSKRGIYLSGGGGKGPFQIGVFKALEELGMDYDLICGSSVGAMVGGAATYLDSYEMFECWKTLTLESVLRVDSKKVKDLAGTKRALKLWKETFLACATPHPNLLIDINDIRNLMYASLDGDKIRESKVGFGVSITTVPDFKRNYYFKENMGDVNTLEYILASLYLPIFTHQKIINNRNYLDVGMFQPCPLEMFKDKGISEIIVVDLESKSINKTLKAYNKQLSKDINLIYIQMDDKSSLLDFSLEMADHNLKYGYDTAMKILEKEMK